MAQIFPNCQKDFQQQKGVKKVESKKGRRSIRDSAGTELSEKKPELKVRQQILSL